jgi:hypothetical protein
MRNAAGGFFSSTVSARRARISSASAGETISSASIDRTQRFEARAAAAFFCAREDARAGGRGDLGGAVPGGRVHDDDDLVRPRDGGEGRRKAVLLVARDERDRELR